MVFMNHQTIITTTCLAAALVSGTGCVSTRKLDISRSNEAITINHQGGAAELTYRLSPPPNSGLPVESGGYFHPVTTPRGVTVTDFAPSDHPHHRGIFLAWVEMHGAKDADFWGWGEHAPIQGRRIVNRSVILDPRTPEPGFRAVNEWVADDAVLIEETLIARSRIEDAVHIVDLTYRLLPKSNLTVSRWAFSGFCVRTRKDGNVEYFSPAGIVRLPNPSHVKPESDWPDAAWYAAVLKLPGGARAGTAVINHPINSLTLWHNHRDVRMLNPCIVAPAALELKQGNPFELRYRVIAFDGDAPAEKLNQLAAEFRR